MVFFVSRYIGQTGDTRRDPVTVHRQQIRETKDQSMAVSGYHRNCAKTFSRALQYAEQIRQRFDFRQQ